MHGRVIMPQVPDQRWSCNSCGNCCRALVGHLFEEDRRKIDAQQWGTRLRAEPYVKAGREWVLNKRPGGACVFLDENNLCRIHAEFGEEAKPFACRIFPFSVRPVQRGWQVSFRFDCPSSARSGGKPIGEYRGWLGALVKELNHVPPPQDDSANLPRGVRATVEETGLILGRFNRWVTNAECSTAQRLIGAARITATLQGATLAKVRGHRLAELLDLLFAALPAESAAVPPSATVRQRRMLRQLAFVHAEHVTLAELRSSFWSRLGKRRRQLANARRFLAGRGAVPRLPEFERPVTFEAAETVGIASEHCGGVDPLLGRYLAARLGGRSVFGDGYYGWSVFSGLSALWLSVAVAGWLARCRAAADGRTSLCFDDVAHAIGIVDRAATRLPSLGTRTERARVLYLSNDDGVARLLHAYAPVPQVEKP